MDSAPRLPVLDALRGYAVLAVMIVHIEQWAPVSSPIAKVYAQHGNYGVRLFFIVSAISIAMTWHARADGYLRFLVRRLFRLLPGMAFAAIGFAALRGVPEWWRIAATFTFLDGFTPATVSTAVFGSWTLSAEMMFYLSVPIFAASIRSLRTAAIWFVCAQAIFMTGSYVVWPFWNAVYPAGIGAPNDNWFWVSPFTQPKWFIMGWAIYLLMQRPALSQGASWALFCLGLSCLAVGPFVRSSTGHEFALMFGLPVAVYAMVCGAASALDNAPMRWLGKISYSMYLWHFVIEWKLFDYLQGPSFPVLFVSTLAVTALCSWATYLLIERPGIRLGAALLRSRARRPVGTPASV